MEPLAIYGAIVATISIVLAITSLVWQIVSSTRAKRTILEVSVHALPPKGPPGWIEVLCINRSEHRVHTIGLSFAHPDGTGEHWLGSDPVAFQVEDFTTTIQPRAATNGVLLYSEFEDLPFDMNKPLVAIVTTEDQRKFKSIAFVPYSLWKEHPESMP